MDNTCNFYFFYAVAGIACGFINLYPCTRKRGERLEVLRLCILRRELGFHDRAGVGKPNLTFRLVLPTKSFVVFFLFAQGLE